MKATAQPPVGSRPLSRRRFISGMAQAGVGSLLAARMQSTPAHAQIVGAGEKVGFALIGCGPRGRIVALNMAREGGRCVALCDLDSGRCEEVNGLLKEHAGSGDLPKYRYAEQVFERKDVDAVIIATPEHWHALQTIQACQAGKDVYVEKPHTHNIWEGHQMLAAAKKYHRVVEVGLQNRSSEYIQAALKYIQEGHLGRVSLVKVYNGDRQMRNTVPLGEPSEPPAGFDWDRYLGPAPLYPYYERLWKGPGKLWTVLWDFGSGHFLDDGTHQTDIALWLMGCPGMPRSVVANGRRLIPPFSDSYVPCLLNCQFEFDEFHMTIDHANYPGYLRKTTSTIRRGDQLPFWLTNGERVELYGEEQMMIVGRHGGGWQAVTYPWQVQAQMFGRPGDDVHVRDFLDCVRTRRQPNASLESTNDTVAVLHMANISHRVGNRQLFWDRKANRFDFEPANKLIKGTYRAGYTLPKLV